MRIALLLVGLAACTDEVSIASGVCGNFVHETGEDCDRPGGVCTSECRIVCDPGARGMACANADAIDGTCCPSDMVCGLDAICHRPTGAVSTAELVQPFDALGFTVADINGDQVADVLSVSSSATEVRYGAVATPLATSASTPTPTPTALPVGPTGTPFSAGFGFGDFDGDGRTDVVIPTSSGLFALVTDTGVPTPVAFPSTITANTTHVRSAVIGGAVLSFLVQLDYVAPPRPTGTTNYQLVFQNMPSYLQQGFSVIDTQTTLCGRDTTAARVARNGLHIFVDGVATLRVPLVIDDSTIAICVATVNPHGTGAAPSYSIPTSYFTSGPGSGYTPSTGFGEILFTNILSTGLGACPDLVVPVTSTALSPVDSTMILKGSGTSGSCTVDMTSTPMTLVGRPLAPITITDPLLGNLLGLVTSVGVYRGFSTTPVVVTAATRPWRQVEVADLNGDGRPDFVAAVVGSDALASNGIEVFRQLPAAASFPQWVIDTIPTVNPVLRVALGNFDADSTGDVAFETFDPSLASLVADLQVAWGSADGNWNTVTDIGSFSEPTDLIASNVDDTSLPLSTDHTDDLLIAHGGSPTPGPSDPTQLVVEYGSTVRAVNAPLIFTSKFGMSYASPVRGVGVMAMPVTLVGGTLAMLAGFVPFDATSGSKLAIAQLTQQTDGSVAIDEADPPLITMGDGKPFSLLDARIERVYRSTDGEMIIGVRHGGDSAPYSQCAATFVTGAGPPLPTFESCAQLAPTVAPGQPGFSSLTEVNIAGVLGTYSGGQQLLLGSYGSHVSNELLWSLDTSSGFPVLSSPLDLDAELAASGVVPAGVGAYCYTANDMQLGSRTVAGKVYGANAKELLVGCSVGSAAAGWTTQLFARYADPTGGAPLYNLVWNTNSDVYLRVAIGDVNGDGLDDIVFSTGTAQKFREELHVLFQCDAHATSCTGGP
jgi:hypothetical protein